jgi:hypothetical protein
LPWKYSKDKSALHATPISAKQNTTPARRNKGHTDLGNLEQSCQRANYYKKTILVKLNKTYHQRHSGILKMQAPHLSLNRQLKDTAKNGKNM